MIFMGSVTGAAELEKKMHIIEIKKPRRAVLNPTKMKVRMLGLYKDKRGNVWKAIEDLKFGRWMLRREDRCIISEIRTLDMEAAGMEYVGQATSA